MRTDEGIAQFLSETWGVYAVLLIMRRPGALSAGSETYLTKIYPPGQKRPAPTLNQRSHALVWEKTSSPRRRMTA
jgi:hypothetical protein